MRRSLRPVVEVVLHGGVANAGSVVRQGAHVLRPVEPAHADDPRLPAPPAVGRVRGGQLPDRRRSGRPRAPRVHRGPRGVARHRRTRRGPSQSSLGGPPPPRAPLPRRVTALTRAEGRRVKEQMRSLFLVDFDKGGAGCCGPQLRAPRERSAPSTTASPSASSTSTSPSPAVPSHTTWPSRPGCVSRSSPKVDAFQIGWRPALDRPRPRPRIVADAYGLRRRRAGL